MEKSINKNGCSVCEAGKENYTTYEHDRTGHEWYQYDYRHTDGRLFSCVGASLDSCRAKRDLWLQGEEE